MKKPASLAKRNKFSALLPLTVGVGLLASPAAAQTNLVTNGGFESQTAPLWGTSVGWIDNNGGFSNPNTGTYALGFGCFATRGAGPCATSQTISVVSGKSYTLSFYYAGGYSGDATVTPNVLTVSFGGANVVSLSNVNTKTFSLYSYTVTASSSSAELRFTGGNDNSTSYVDDVSLVLLQTGPDATNTTAAMRTNADALRGVMGRRLSGLGFVANYDCATFDKNGFCLSFQARYSNYDSWNDGAGVLTAAYRLTDAVRVGAFVDYRASEKAPPNIKFSNDLPTFGLFAAYSDKQNGTGLQAKVLAARQTGDASVTRAADPSLNTEPGSGRGSLNAYVVSAEMGWGFAVAPAMVATPFAGLRYTDIARGGYSESTTTDVTSPITYNDYSQRLTTANLGLRIAGMFTDKVGYQASAGVEHDLRQQTGSYSGSSTIAGLETFALSMDGVNNRTRGFASAGLFYQVEKNQRLISQVSLRNQAYTNQTMTTVMGGYQVAF